MSSRRRPPSVRAETVAGFGRERVPEVAIRAAAKRYQRPTQAEGFDRLEQVVADEGRFEITPYDGAREEGKRRTGPWPTAHAPRAFS